ncbi:RDD family protein [Gynuella sunshinyii]|uniref:Putative membrane protein/domain n=1 Tax=Gynuella sunshinyii YC6258 TaxID=1445510 RepID=A0A0C5VFU2_9GAMM|nr:RDD family protein [Gynuella sunshinyii]AJQ93462.1 putative membrane protein/domain [Gynuella sunshinyii YC6258]
MSAWTVLGIEPTDDARAIKLAYSSALKKCRPDEDPDGFQALHRAYKTLSRQVGKSSAVKAASQVEDDPVPADTSSAVVPTPENVAAVITAARVEDDADSWAPEADQPVVILSPVFDDVETTQQVAHIEVQTLVDELYELLCQFAEAGFERSLQRLAYQALDLTLLEQRRFTVETFECLLRLERKVPVVYRNLFDSEALYTLLQQMNWLQQRTLLEQECDLNETDRQLTLIQEYLKKHQRGLLRDQRERKARQRQQAAEAIQQQAMEFNKQKAAMANRCLAYLLDLMLVNLGAVLFAGLLTFNVPERSLGTMVLMELAGYFTYFIFFEYQYGCTPMKRLLRMTVINRAGGNPGFWHIVWRTFSLFLSFITLKLFFIHLYFWWSKKGALHDTFSRTYVIKRARS